MQLSTDGARNLAASKVSDAKKLKNLADENRKLKKLLAESELAEIE